MSLIRNPCDPHGNASTPQNPKLGSEELSIGLPWLMSLRHNSGNKQRAGAEAGEEGMRWDEWRRTGDGCERKSSGSGEIPAEG